MKQLIMRLLILFSLLFLINIAATTFERKLKSILNPGLPSGINISSDVVYISALGKTDQLHYLWTSLGVPTVLMIQTDVNATIHIDYDKLFNDTPSGAITFYNGSIQNSFAVVFNKVFEFDDDNESGMISNQTIYPVFFNDSFYRNLTVENTSQLVDEIFTSNFPNGTIKMEMSVCNCEKRNSLLPHLQYTTNSTQVELTIEGPAKFTKSRLALEMFIYSNSEQNLNMSFNNQNSIDDEYTPGIFEINDLRTPNQSSDPHYVGYVQWKPLSYQSSNRAVNDIARLTTYPVYDAEPNETQSPIIEAFYNKALLNIMIKKTNVSFGEKGDDFYKNFNSWTLNIGLGIPPEDKISTHVIIIIAIIMGLPTILFISGFVGLKIRNRVQPRIRSAYEQIG